MNRKEIILAGLAPANGAFHSPVQVQKLFFLIDRNIAREVDGPHFNFQPYNYGPFDKAVYETLKELENEGFVEIGSNHNWKEYKLTDQGQLLGTRLLGGLPSNVANYIGEVALFVRKLTFTQLVSAIYRDYPEMKVNSVFQE